MVREVAVHLSAHVSCAWSIFIALLFFFCGFFFSFAARQIPLASCLPAYPVPAQWSSRTLPKLPLTLTRSAGLALRHRRPGEQGRCCYCRLDFLSTYCYDYYFADRRSHPNTSSRLSTSPSNRVPATHTHTTHTPNHVTDMIGLAFPAPTRLVGERICTEQAVLT